MKFKDLTIGKTYKIDANETKGTPLPINHAPFTSPQKYIQKMQENVQKHAFSHPSHICITVIIFSSMVLPVEFYHEAPRG
jgi:hypothetical protein